MTLKIRPTRVALAAISMALGALMGAAGARWLLPVALLGGQRADSGPVIASYGDITLHEADLRARLALAASQGRVSSRGTTGRREFVRSELEADALEAEAHRRGFEQTLEVRLALRDRQNELFLEDIAKSAVRQTAPTDDEVARYIAAHRDEWAQPERWRLSQIRLEKEQRTVANKLAEEVKAAAKRDYTAFASAARKHSTDRATRPYGGELGALSRPELETHFGADAAKAIAALPLGVPTVVESPDAVYVVQVASHDPAVEPSPAVLSSQVRVRLVAERKRAALTALQDSLKSRGAMTIDEASIDALRLEAPTGATK